MSKGRQRFLLILVGIFLSLPVIEGMSRFYLWITRRAAGPRILDYSYFDSTGAFRIKPNKSGWHIGYDNFPVKVRTNSDGFRCPEIRESPESRVVFDGGVRQERTFMSLTEKLFRTEGADVEVINGGTTDAGVDQYLLQVKSDSILALRPDVIVIGFYLNDSRPPQGYLAESKGTFLDFLNLPLLKDLAMTHLIEGEYVAIQVKRGRIFDNRFEWIKRFRSVSWKRDLSEFKQMVQEARYDWGAAWEPSFDNVVFPVLREIRDLSLKNGITLAVVLFPVSPQVYTELKDSFSNFPQAKLLEFAKKENIPVLDLLPALGAYKNKRLFLNQCHLNQWGNEVVANSIYPFLKEILNNEDKYY